MKDVDVASFDPIDLSTARDNRARAALIDALLLVSWDAKNQAGVHTWTATRFGFEVDPLVSTADGIATWPETATAVAVRLDKADQVEVTGVTGGVEDLVAGLHRHDGPFICSSQPDRFLSGLLGQVTGMGLV